MNLKSFNSDNKRKVIFEPIETKPYGLCSDCYKRNTCNVITQTAAKITHCVYR